MNARCETNTLDKVKCEAAAVFIFQDPKILERQVSYFGKTLGAKLQAAVALKDFTGKRGEILAVYTESAIPSPRLVLVGIGEAEKISLEIFRRAAAGAATKAQSMKAASLAFQFPLLEHLPASLKNSSADVAQAIVEGAGLSLYKYDKYLTENIEKKKLESLIFFIQDKKDVNEIQKGLRAGEILCAAVCHARDLENAPSNELYPETLALKPCA